MWSKLKKISIKSTKDLLALFLGILKFLFIILFIRILIIVSLWPIFIILALSVNFSPYYLFLLIVWLFYFYLLKNTAEEMDDPIWLINILNWALNEKY